MSGNCAPIYNFYNCCDCNGKGGGNGGNGDDKSDRFVWQPDTTLTYTQDFTGSGVDPLIMGGSISIIDSDKKDYLNLKALHAAADLLGLSILRFASNVPSLVDIPSSYAASIDLEVVVMDYMGAVLRTISLAPMNYKALPNKVWTAIPLTAITADLSIQPGELVAARVKFGAASPAVQLYFTLSGIGRLI